ncbi:MAG: hypothetical protein FJ102_27490 [Deltaproteobacteria bacterium]|nr:hypothetical protein [Deltaproteobacteria bacterium]
MSVDTTGGRFATAIGAAGTLATGYADLTSLVQDETSLYLAIHLDACDKPELGTRQAVNAGAFSLRAQKAQSAETAEASETAKTAETAAAAATAMTAITAQKADALSLSCAPGQILAYDGNAWGCANDEDTDTNTTYTAGTGLSLADGAFSVNLTWGDARYLTREACAEGEVLAMLSGAWACHDLGTVFATDEEEHQKRLPEVSAGVLTNEYDRSLSLAAPVALADLVNESIPLASVEKGALLGAMASATFAHPHPDTLQVKLTYVSGEIKQVFNLQSAAACPAQLAGPPVDCSGETPPRAARSACSAPRWTRTGAGSPRTSRPPPPPRPGRSPSPTSATPGPASGPGSTSRRSP